LKVVDLVKDPPYGRFNNLHYDVFNVVVFHRKPQATAVLKNLPNLDF